MAKIKIITTPTGVAPQRIREQWIGIEIPLSENPIPKRNGVFNTGNSNGDGYRVNGTDAVKALIAVDKHEAADYWIPYQSGKFFFKKDVCELIE